MAFFLTRETDAEIAGQAGTGLGALALCERWRPDLLILDAVLPELCGSEVIRRVRVLQPGMRILVFSSSASERVAIETLKARPDGFICKRDALPTLRAATAAILRGGSYYTPFATRHFFASQPPAGGMLSAREREVLQMVAEGLSSKEISTRLNLAVKTVENHRAHLMDKLALHDVASLTRHALKLGLVALD